MWEGILNSDSNAKRQRLYGSQGEQGFTLIELLVVLAILSLLIGLVAPAALRQLGGAKEKIASQTVQRLVGILDIYKLDIGEYPTNEEGLQALVARPAGSEHWNGPYIKDSVVPVDPWDHPFIYRNPSSRPNHDLDICSLGPTGKAGGNGEICNR